MTKTSWFYDRTRLEVIRTRLEVIRTRLDVIRTRLKVTRTSWFDDGTRLEVIRTRLIVIRQAPFEVEGLPLGSRNRGGSVKYQTCLIFYRPTKSSQET